MHQTLTQLDPRILPSKQLPYQRFLKSTPLSTKMLVIKQKTRLSHLTAAVHQGIQLSFRSRHGAVAAGTSSPKGIRERSNLSKN